MQTYLPIFASLLYLGCAFLPSRLHKGIAAATLLGWFLHGAALGGEVLLLDS